MKTKWTYLNISYSAYIDRRILLKCQFRRKRRRRRRSRGEFLKTLIFRKTKSIV